MQISQGKTQNCPCVGAGLIKHTHPRMEDFVVGCPLVPGVPHLLSGSCASPRTFGLGFLQTPPPDDALALLLAFGSADTWRGVHPTSSVPCLAHTPGMSRALLRVGSMPLFGKPRWARDLRAAPSLPFRAGHGVLARRLAHWPARLQTSPDSLVWLGLAGTRPS